MKGIGRLRAAPLYLHTPQSSKAVQKAAWGGNINMVHGIKCMLRRHRQGMLMLVQAIPHCSLLSGYGLCLPSIGPPYMRPSSSRQALGTCESLPQVENLLHLNLVNISTVKCAVGFIYCC